VANSVAPAAPVKLVILPRTRAGLSRGGLRQHLETVHGPMVVNEPEVAGRFVSYVHHYAQDLTAPKDAAVLHDRDAVTIIRLPGLADLGASKANAGYHDRIGPDEDNFRDIDGSVALLAEAQEVAPGADDAPRKLFIFRNAMPRNLDAWASTIADIVRDQRLLGAIINSAKPVEGHFPYAQFDEIGLPLATDPASVANIVTMAARAQFGEVDTALILTEPVRFI